MPPGRASLYRTVEITDADVAALQKKLRICNLCPGLPFHLKGRRKRFKMSFYIFVIHAAKIIQNHISDKAGIAFTARRASVFDQGFHYSGAQPFARICLYFFARMIWFYIVKAKACCFFF